MKTVISRNAKRSRTTRSGPGSGRGRAGRMTAGFVGTMLLVAAATSAAWAAIAEDDDMLDVTGLIPVSDESLDGMRGGFSIGPYNVNFGVVVTTAINNQLVLMTSFKVETLGKIEDIKQDVLDGYQQFLHDNVPPGAAGSAAAQAAALANTAVNSVPDAPAAAALEAAANATDSAKAAAQDATNMAAELTAAAQNAAQNAAQGATQHASQAAADATSAASDAAASAVNAATSVASADLSNFIVSQIQNGVLIQDTNGTQVMQQLSNGVLTEIMNIANGAQVSHMTEMNLFITNFSDVINQHSLGHVTNNLALEAVRNNPLLGQ